MLALFHVSILFLGRDPFNHLGTGTMYLCSGKVVQGVSKEIPGKISLPKKLKTHVLAPTANVDNIVASV